MMIFVPAVSQQEVHIPTATLHCSSSLRAASRLAFHLQTGISLPCFLLYQELFHYRHHCWLLSALHTGQLGIFCYLWSFMISFADYLVQHLDFESFLAGLEVWFFWGFFFTSEPMGKLQTQSTMERIKSCFLSFFTKKLFFYGWP